MDRTGQTLLGKYELTRLLGRGGMGEVWEGEHAVTGRRVAVKVLSEKYLSNRKVVKRFGREARAASAVNHPGIVEILDHDRTPEGVPFLVMEFLEGESLGERLRDKGRLKQREALAVMLPLLDALDAAHSHGVIHRDLKPDNIYLSPDTTRGQQHVKILDFGISQKADEIDHKLTQEGSVLGTPHYMSPEQAKGELGIDARADIYAAGVLLYELVVGDVPFDAGNYNALLQIILGTPPVAPRQRGAAISPAVEQVVLAALEKDRNKRPADARTFRRLLAEAAEAPEGAVLDLEAGRFEQPAPKPSSPAVFARPSRPATPSEALVASLPEIGSEPPTEAAPDPFGESGSGGFAALEEPGELPPLELDDGLSARPPAPSDELFDSFAPPASSTAPTAGAPAAAPAPAPDLFDSRERPQASSAVLDFETTAQAALDNQSVHSSFAPGAPKISTPRPTSMRPRGADGESRAPSARGAALAERMVQQRRQRSLKSVLRGVGNWVVALALIAGVVFLISQLFERDDPRRKRRVEPPESASSE